MITMLQSFIRRAAPSHKPGQRLRQFGGILLVSAGMAAPLSALESTGTQLRFSGYSSRWQSGITTTLPRGYQQLVLEVKQGDGWKPLKVNHYSASSARANRKLSLTVPKGVKANQLRVMAYTKPKFPARFVAASKVFSRKSSDSLAANAALAFNKSNFAQSAPPVAAVNDAVTAPTQPVVESDIWKVVGKQLFFFNQYRGLQCLDLSQPLVPQRTGTLRLPAVGEQFYALNADGSALVLLGRSTSTERAGQSALFVMSVSAGVPRLVKELPLEGDVADSRLIGSTLRLVSRVWSDQGHQTVIQSVDFRDPSAPVVLETVRMDDYFRAVQVAEDKMLVSTGQGQESVVHVWDVSAATAAPQFLKSLTLKGVANDQFKLHVNHNTVAAVSNLWSDGLLQTWVETFALAGDQTAPLAQLELEGARGETLHATRFDGDRVYVVTFRQVDPLFVVDLADPAQPKLTAALEIPGWSTYLHPMGDRLLAVGVEGGRVTVSLFDVADLGSPKLLSRQYLGAEGSWSWSEANYDEKAVEFSDDLGVVLVPFQQWGTAGVEGFIQFVQVGRDELTLGAAVAHRDQARRGAVIGDHVVSISGQELLVSAKDGSDAKPLAQLSLAWTVDRVFAVADSLVEVENGPSLGRYYDFIWAGQSRSSKPVLRLARKGDADDVRHEVELGVGRIVAATQQDRRLYLAQWDEQTRANEGAVLRTWAVEVSADGAKIEVIDSAEQLFAGVSQSSVDLERVQALWPSESELVWYVPGQVSWNRWWVDWFRVMPQPVRLTDSGGVVADASLPMLPYYQAPLVGAATAWLCPVQIEGTNLLSGAPLKVGATDRALSYSRAFAEKGFVFFSYDETEVIKKSVKIKPAGNSIVAGSIEAPGAGTLIRSWLQVVDVRGAEPVIRDVTSLPGALMSVSQVDAQGAVLLTNSEGGDERSRVVQACGYDGVSAFLLDQLKVDAPQSNASVAAGAALYFSRESSQPGVLGVGYRAGDGKIVSLASWSLAAEVSSLNVVSGHLLANRYGRLDVAAIATDGSLQPRGGFDLPSQLWLRDSECALAPDGLWLPAGAYGVESFPWQPPVVEGPTGQN